MTFKVHCMGKSIICEYLW